MWKTNQNLSTQEMPASFFKDEKTRCLDLNPSSNTGLLQKTKSGYAYDRLDGLSIFTIMDRFVDLIERIEAHHAVKRE